MHVIHYLLFLNTNIYSAVLQEYFLPSACDAYYTLAGQIESLYEGDFASDNTKTTHNAGAD